MVFVYWIHYDNNSFVVKCHIYSCFVTLFSIVTLQVDIRMKVLKLGHDNQQLRKEQAMLLNLLAEDDRRRHQADQGLDTANDFISGYPHEVSHQGDMSTSTLAEDVAMSHHSTENMQAYVTLQQRSQQSLEQQNSSTVHSSGSMGDPRQSPLHQQQRFARVHYRQTPQVC